MTSRTTAPTTVSSTMAARISVVMPCSTRRSFRRQGDGDFGSVLIKRGRRRRGRPYYQETMGGDYRALQASTEAVARSKTSGGTMSERK